MVYPSTNGTIQLIEVIKTFNRTNKNITSRADLK